MILSVKDRLLLTPMLPQTGARMEMILVNELLSEIEFNSQEVELFELQDMPGGMVKGNYTKFTDKAIVITDSQAKVLKDAVKALDQKKMITRDMLPLLDKIDRL